MRFPPNSTRGRLLLAAVAGGLLCLNLARAQSMNIAGLSWPEYFDPPYQNQVKSLISAAAAAPQTNGCYLMREAKVETFRTNGVREAVVTTPECLYDRAARTVTARQIHVQTDDERVIIDGEDCLWQQTNSMFTVSNRVHTRLRLDATNAATVSLNRRQEIDSDHLVFDSQQRIATYTGNVALRDFKDQVPQGRLKSDRLIVGLANTNGVESLLAEGNVLVERDDISASGDQARYRVGEEVVEVSGHAKWWQGQREGRADTLVFRSDDGSFRADRNVYVKLPRGTAELPELFSLEDRAATNLPAGTNQFIEVCSDSFFRRTNVAVFTGHVQATNRANDQLRGTLACGTLSMLSATNGQFESLTAEQSVTLTQGPKEARGERLVYSRATGLAEVTGNPAWKLNGSEGMADWLQFDLNRKALAARRNVRVQMPWTNGNSALFALPDFTVRTNAAGSGARRLQVACDEHDLTPASAEFRGGVTASGFEADQLQERLTSGRLTVSMNPTNQRAERVVASQRVVVEQIEQSTNQAARVAQRLGCEVLTVSLNATNGQVDTLTAEQKVEFDASDEKGRKAHGTGDRAVYTYTVTPAGTNAVVKLMGHPTLAIDHGAVTGGEAIAYDLLTKKYSITGPYTGVGNPVRSEAAGTTNAVGPAREPAKNGASRSAAPRNGPPQKPSP